MPYDLHVCKAVEESLIYWTSENKSAREMYYSMRSNLSKKPHKNNQPKTHVPPPAKTIKTKRPSAC